MRKNYLFLVFLFAFSNVMFSQKVTLTPTVVNGKNVSGGPINLESVPYSTVSLGVTVEMPTIPGNTGTLTIYSINGLSVNVVSGGNGGALFFGEGKLATRSFFINLNWSAFATSGSYIYAEYKTSGNVAYKSSYMAVVKNATQGGGTLDPPADAPDPSKITNTLCCNQTIRLGDKPAPITGSQYLNPYSGQLFGINSSWAVNGNPNVHILSLDDSNKILTLDYITAPGNFTVTRSLGYGNLSNSYKSNSVNITVVPSPILTNTISTNGVPNSDGYYELSSVKTLDLTGFSSLVNLNILQDPTHTNQRGDITTDVDSYKWEYSKFASNIWTTIPNEILGNLNFSDPSQLSSFEDTNYLVRRIAIYKDISRVSNEIKVIVRGLRFNNTICCDQILKIQPPTNFDPPQIIIGSIASVDSPIQAGDNFQVQSITYQWQSQNTTGVYSTSVWSNILGATSKDYLPSEPLKVGLDRRGRYAFESSYRYRRIAKVNYSVVKNNSLIYGTTTSYSNETSLDGTTSVPYIQIYPNPTSSILNIECTVDISNAKVTISNILGNIVNSNNYSVVNPKLISINVADFITGTYFITIENQSLGISQRTFIKQ